MQIETKEMVIFLRDDGISLQYPDGQCAGYGIDGNMLIFMGQSCELFPIKSFCTISALRTLPTNSQVMNPDIKTG